MTPLTPEGRAEVLARFYDLDTTDIHYDAELYQQLAQLAPGPVLELAVGSGRLAIPLALAGHRVVGIDQDPAMLARASRAWQGIGHEGGPGSLELHEADFRTYRGEPGFGLAFLAVNTFLLAADDDERLAILETMRDHLAPGGIAAIEVSTPDGDTLDGYDGHVQSEWLREDPETGDVVSKSMVAWHDPEAGTVELTQIYEWTPAHGGTLSRVTRQDLLHLVSAEDLAALATRAGFGHVEVWGDHLLIPHGAGSHRAILEVRLV